MGNFFRITVLVITGFLFTCFSYSSEFNLADDYMQAYSEFDMKRLAEFYSDDAIFIDPTSEIWGDKAVKMYGKEQIFKRWEALFLRFDKISAAYNVKTKYHSAGHSVYTGKVKFSTVKKGEAETSTSCAFITTIISVKEGKVVEHRDYFDYDTWKASKKIGDQDC